MKRYRIFVLVAAVLFMAAPAQGAILFSEDFESGLYAWTGKPSGEPHHGITPGKHPRPGRVLTFTALNSNGDIFTANTFHSTTGSYVLSFDYLGDPTMGGAPGDLGGFIGYEYRPTPGERRQVWLAGTTKYGGLNYPDILIDDGTWHHYDIPFSHSGDITIMIEDFSGSHLPGSPGVAGDAYFDNVRLTDATLVDVGNGVVYDRALRIDWTKDANIPQYIYGFNWYEAKQWAADLVYGGYDDWRLPTIDELRHLSGEGVSYYIPYPFENVSAYTPNCYYWSETDYDATRAWGFSLGYGVDGQLAKNQYSYVMAVRNVPEPATSVLLGIGVAGLLIGLGIMAGLPFRRLTGR